MADPEVHMPPKPERVDAQRLADVADACSRWRYSGTRTVGVPAHILEQLLAAYAWYWAEHDEVPGGA